MLSRTEFIECARSRTIFFLSNSRNLPAQVEVKHGRISMLAILGHLVTTAGYRLPGDIAYGVPFADVKSGFAAFETVSILH